MWNKVKVPCRSELRHLQLGFPQHPWLPRGFNLSRSRLQVCCIESWICISDSLIVTRPSASHWIFGKDQSHCCHVVIFNLARVVIQQAPVPAGWPPWTFPKSPVLSGWRTKPCQGRHHLGPDRNPKATPEIRIWGWSDWRAWLNPGLALSGILFKKLGTCSWPHPAWRPTAWPSSHQRTFPSCRKPTWTYLKQNHISSYLTSLTYLKVSLCRT